MPLLKRIDVRLDHLGDELLELDNVSGEGTDALSGLFGGHGVLVELKAEGFFVVGDLFEIAGASGVELALEGSLGVLQLFEKAGRNGEKIATGKAGDLSGVPEGRSHDLGLVAVFLVVAVDLGNGLHAGIFIADVIGVVLLFEPVVDATDEGGDELDSGFGTSDGLGEGEEESEIAVDAFLLEFFSSLDAFPSGSDLDEDAVARDALGLVGGDELFGFRDGGCGVEGKTGVDFGGNTTRNDLEDLKAEEDEDAVEDGFDQSVTGLAGFLEFLDSLLNDAAILGLAGSLKDERGVGGGILRLVFLHGGEVPSVCNDGGESF